MFGRRKPPPESIYDAPIERLILEMTMNGPDSDEYSDHIKYLEKLSTLKTREKSVERRVSPDTVWLIGGNILIAVIIVAYEQKHVFGSKAIGFIGRMTARALSPSA